MSDTLELSFGFRFEDLYEQPGLARLDARFLDWLAERDAALAGRLTEARNNPAALSAKQQSDLIKIGRAHV